MNIRFVVLSAFAFFSALTLIVFSSNFVIKEQSLVGATLANANLFYYYLLSFLGTSLLLSGGELLLKGAGSNLLKNSHNRLALYVQVGFSFGLSLMVIYIACVQAGIGEICTGLLYSIEHRSLSASEVHAASMEAAKVCSQMAEVTFLKEISSGGMEYGCLGALIFSFLFHVLDGRER